MGSVAERVLIRAKRVIADAELIFQPGFVLLEGQKIVQVGHEDTLSNLALSCEQTFQADLVVPGFIDIHTHGVGGTEEIGEFWQNPKYTLQRVVKYGTTSLLATLVFPKGTQASSAEPAAKRSKFCGCDFGCSCRGFAPNVAASVPLISAQLNEILGKTGLGAVLEGIHAEGPIVETLGGLPASETGMQRPEFDRLLDMLGPALKVMTIAPSVEARHPQPFQRLKSLLERGVRPALGHDNAATVEEVAQALRLATDYGKSLHITHAFNVQRFHHRECGLANVAMLPRLPNIPEFCGSALPTAEFIGDSVHVSPLVLQSVVACKPIGAACFITDGIAEPVCGMTMKYCGREAAVEGSRGKLAVYSTSVDKGHKVLIGSCAMMLDAFRTAVNVLGVSIARAVDFCCCTPAAIAGLPHVGALRPGMRADLVLLNDDLEVEQVIVGGTVAHSTIRRSNEKH
eukprot:TRINITY_DN77014_c0_g1_i1.p1 TRINITY_DN77014_c0_g1~~TRINITY_DN77014_c0_g1_i1.p1  ORF type:complete len:457 (+),score=59.67 TRINITY_DN77014_c0_g1_i1:119-1489(+)